MARLPDFASVYRLIAAEGQALKLAGQERFVLIAPYSDARAAGISKKRANEIRVDVTDALVGGRLTLAMEGASTLTLDVHDPEWKLEDSGILDLDDDLRLGDIDLEVNGVWFRLAQATRQEPYTCRLVFEDLTVAVLRGHRKPLKASRGSVTRGQFIERLVNELPAPLRVFYSPEKTEKQPTQAPDFPDATTKPDDQGSGFDDGVRVPIGDAAATATQKAAIATTMTVCDQLNVSELVRQAITVAGLGESGFDPSRTDYDTHTHKGVFQSNQIPQYDTEAQARHFLQGGRSFLAGGAIRLAKANPHMTPGEIATRVEISNGSSGYYNSFLDNAKKIIGLWNGSSSSSSADTIFTLKAYQFTRGLPGRKENSWEAMTRLADEVSWRVFVAGGVVAYVSDDYLIAQAARLTLDSPTSDVLLSRPTYDWDHGKLAGNVELEVLAERWSQLPGTVVSLAGNGWGPVAGRWLVLEVDQNLFADDDCHITLTKPMAARKEPAPEVQTQSGDDPATRGSGTGSTFYVGDSLGVGTLPFFKTILRGRRVGSDVVSGRNSFSGVQALEAAFKSRTWDNIVFDMGTNDQRAKMLRQSIKRARKIAPEAHIYVMTLNGPYDTGAKNELLQDWSDPHVHVVSWRAHSTGLLSSDGIHATAAGYEARAHLIAKAMGFE